jgi:hypothetical protein
MGLEPSTRVQQRGGYYVVHAVDPRGAEVRVVADMRSGTILSVLPLHGSAVQALRHSGGPRIIHVPQPDEVTESTVIYGRSDAAAPRETGRSRAAPPQTTSAPPPPPGRRRTMLNVPRQKDRPLSPIYPTPRFDTESEGGKKFEQHDSDAAGDAPPPSAN